MNTVILMWNPSISDYTIEKHIASIDTLNTPWWKEPIYVQSGQWAVHDKRIKEGDRFFMMRVGDCHAGLVMSGWITSDIFYEDNWNGDGTKRPYVKFLPEVMLESSQTPHISLKMLEHWFPSFEWSGGHSGRILTEKDAGRLEKEWLEFLYKNRDCYEKSRFFATNDYHLEVNPILNAYLQKKKEMTCDVGGHNYHRLFGPECDLKHDYFFLPPSAGEMPKGDSVWNHVKCLCTTCQMAYGIDK